MQQTKKKISSFRKNEALMERTAFEGDEGDFGRGSEERSNGATQFNQHLNEFFLFFFNKWREVKMGRGRRRGV